MIKFKPLQKIFRKRKVESSMKDYLVLSKKDIEKLLNGQTISFEVEKFIPEIMVCTEEQYEKVMSEIKAYKYD